MINNCRNLVIWADSQKVWRKLIPLDEIDAVQRIGQAQLLESDGDFMPIRRWCVIEVDHKSGRCVDVVICLPFYKLWPSERMKQPTGNFNDIHHLVFAPRCLY